MTEKEKYEIIKQLCEKNGCLVTASHPEGIMCSITCGWDEEVDEYLYYEYDEEDVVEDLKSKIPHQISIWDNCHDSDIGVLYCSTENIEIKGSMLTIKDGDEVFGSMRETMWNDLIEFNMYVPFNV